MSYYLPTTIKLLRSYDELSRQGVSGENITGTMEKVEGMLGTIVLAFEKQLDGLKKQKEIESKELSISEEDFSDAIISVRQMNF